LYPSDSKIKLFLFPSQSARGKFTIILSDPSVTKKASATEEPEFDCELGKVTVSCSGSLFSQFWQEDGLL